MQESIIFSACTRSLQRKFTFAISSPDEFLVIRPITRSIMNQPAYKFNNSARDISAISEHSSVLPKFVRQKKQCHVIKKNK